MELESIKLSGFKSFADPTVLPLKTKLIAVVGPNGCGKSNIVDAVRCVLSGAARQLRGDTLPDVIFNGSTNRKPVGQASVELVFDNSDGGFGGEYAQFSQVSIRREINRDGTSDYYLNGASCRRRDVVDLFLGTGLRYAIIEQGMISRLVEAKPEEIRMHIEEAAGTSVYKERRRETENRLQHTKENLERLNDHLIESEKQLKHLQRQANAAERYKEYKKEERLLKAELQVLYWQQLKEEIEEQDRTIKAEENRYEATVANLRHLDLELEKLREEKNVCQDTYNEINKRYFVLGSQIARHEQNINNLRERRTQLANDLAQLEKNYAEINQHYTEDQIKITQLATDIGALDPQINHANTQETQLQEALNNAEKIMQEWQNAWNEFNQKVANITQTIHVEQTRIHHLEQNIANNSQRIHRLNEERNHLNPLQLEEEIRFLTEEHANYHAELIRLQEKTQNLIAQRDQNKNSETQTYTQLEQLRNQLQNLIGRRSSLQALQQAALGKNDQTISQWLQQQQIQDQTRLAETLDVQSGWETAVETVLGNYLEAVWVDDIEKFTLAASSLKNGYLGLIKKSAHTTVEDPKNFLPLLKTKVQSTLPVDELLTGIYAAETLTAALQYCEQLTGNESIITAQGIWLGKNWLRIIKGTDAKAGIIQREKELHDLNHKIKDLEQEKISIEQQLADIKTTLLETENEHKMSQESLIECSAKTNDLQSRIKNGAMQIEQIQARDAKIIIELEEHTQSQQQANQDLKSAQQTLEAAQLEMTHIDQEKTKLQQQKLQYQLELDQCREKSQKNKAHSEELHRRLITSNDQLQFLKQAITRAEKQLQDMQQRQDEIRKLQSELTIPLQENEQQLSIALENRLSVEHELEASKIKINSIEHNLRSQETQRQETQKTLENLRSELEQVRMKLQALKIGQEHHNEKIVELNFIREELLQQISAEANIPLNEEKIQQLENKIQRLGPINLAAIEEHKVLLEKKTYLDTQYNDLIEAINTLENAIHKIDRETRSKLQETFEKVNTEFNALFQRIFNGGNAQLELVGDDLLSTGIIVKAQPPGKKNTTIHLLSGGEKALTATALVFAMFQLNPAPFCILDEVDAPLDDINVGRFGTLVKEMSKKVQFIFISHNKLTIEIADQLVGVTMLEPGVSRLVSVDVQQAIDMATS